MSTMPPSAPPPPLPMDRGGTIMGHPKGLFLLFFVEMWERFSYYGMRALLVLYLINVIAVNQLAPGVYTNTLEFEETPAAAEGQQAPPAGPGGTQTRTMVIAVSQPGTPAQGEAATGTAGAPALVITRLRGAPDPKEPDKFSWEPDEAGGNTVVVRGDAGTTSFENDVAAFEVRNPTAAPIKLTVRVRREGGPTYFRVNNNPDSVTADIKPDSALGPEEVPFRVVTTVNTHDSGRNWTRSDASVLYGWYTGLAYLFPILGGLIADKVIGTHRSMLVGGVLISIGHIILGLSGLGDLAYSPMGMSMFIMGLAVVILGTGHFKPTVSVMVGQLYGPGDPRRDGAFTIFYMGINLGAFLCAFVCGTLGEKVGWHWGFGAAAVGMLLGLGMYIVGRPAALAGIGEAPRPNAGGATFGFFLLSLGLAAGFAALYHFGLVGRLGDLTDYLSANPAVGYTVMAVLVLALAGALSWFLAINAPEDRGPVLSIFIFMFFNAFFWLAFEQAGSSINLFTEQNTDRTIGSFEVPATWFQSVNAGLIFMLAPLFAAMWTGLGRRRMNPSQPMKIALGLLFLGLGFVFMVIAGRVAQGGVAKASMILILATYFWHTVGELFLSPTGLSYVTKVAPVRFVSLLMGVWFISSFIANLGGGLVASRVEAIEKGDIKLPWEFGGQADFFFLFVVTSIGAGVLIAVLTPLLKKLIQGREDVVVVS